MKKLNIFLFLLVMIFYSSCKDNSTSPEVNTYHTYIGWVFVADSIGQVTANKNSEVKITLLETGATVFTDSSGHYTYQNLPTGTYNFKYEYSNYPIYYFQDVALNGEDGSILHSNGSEISPRSIWDLIIDSTSYGTTWSSGKSAPDKSIIVYFTRISPKITSNTSWLWIMSKSANDLDYSKGQYLLIEGWWSGSITPSLSSSIFHHVMYDSLRAKGFQQGDSVCIKLYSLNSISYYIDRNSGKRIYPSIGTESKIMSTILK